MENRSFNTDIKTILIPIALRAESLLALKQALVFRKKYNCNIVLLHVMKSKSLLQRFFNLKRNNRRLKKIEKKVDKFASSFFEGNLPPFISIKIASGSIISTIKDVANELKADLIIIKKKEKKNSKWKLLNIENADKLISDSKCPVITITKYLNTNNIENILIPVDITKKIASKIEWGKHLALKFNAKVHVVSVLDLNISPVKSLALRKAKTIEQSMHKSGIDVHVELLKSMDTSKYETLTKHIQKLKPDLVLTMTHQESILFDNYIGEFAREIIHGSTSPVFSLVPRKETIVTNILDTLQPKKHHAIY